MLIDCDVHPGVHPGDTIANYLPDGYRRRFRDLPDQSRVYPTPNTSPDGASGRMDSIPPRGGRPGSDPALLKSQLMDQAGVDYAVFIPTVAGQALDPDTNWALRAGVNTWLDRTWLSKNNEHGLFRGSISIPYNNPAGAVAEIEKWAGHPYFVQVWTTHRTGVPYGSSQYHPIWEAAARHGLPVAIHANGQGQGGMPTPAGYVRYYVELHAVAESLAYMAHLTSLVCGGVFEKFPDLRVVLVEGGFSWIAPLMWRLDKAWAEARSEFPLLKRAPSEYIYEHVRFTSQPIEEPDQEGALVSLFREFDASRILMFATDYPHWDFDDPARALPRGLTATERDRIRSGNAQDLYRIVA